MSKLLSVQESVQHIAESISAVLNFETMVLDENLQIIAGTGKYARQIGSFEAETFIPEEYLYKYILRIGGTYVVNDINDPLYGPELYGETGEICCAIPYHTGCVGVVSLVSFTDEQKQRLVDNSVPICNYLMYMSQLISSFLSNHENFEKLNMQTKTLNEVINASPHCILVLNENGYITEFNRKARDFLQHNKNRFWGILGKNIDTFWDGAFSTFSEETKPFKNQEITFSSKGGDVRLLVSSSSIREGDKIKSIVIFFDDMNEAKNNAVKILNSSSDALNDIKGSSPQIQQLKKMVIEVADSSSTVLITGDSGTGKELFAKALHFGSHRKSAPFVTINCGAIPETLLESELFGYASGAFTGASPKGHMGRFEKAHGGTVFIDEIGELTLTMQTRLLHVLQRKQLERVGSTDTIDIDVRIIAATNQDLEEMVRQGSFRSDLYYRLNVIPMKIPPLTERSQDIPVLANYFINRHTSGINKSVDSISMEAIHVLMNHTWPGNVRELENAIEYGINMARHSTITTEDLPPSLCPTGTASSEMLSYDGSFRDNITSFERNLLTSQLEEVEKGNMTKTELARKLGISRSSLYRKLEKL